MNSVVKIGDKTVGQGHPVFIIAEAGANHNRDLKMAYDLIDLAAEANADAVKFQTYSGKRLYSKYTPQFEYLKKLFTKSTQDLLTSIEIPREWHPKLKERAESKGLMFLSTPFDEEAVDELAEVGVPAFKIGSFEMVNTDLLGYAAQKGKPLIVSVGMANYEEIQDVVSVMEKTGNLNLVLLQCVSTYPAPPHISNLRSIETMNRMFSCPVGYSDHTHGIHIPVAAVAAGACLIEKHYTLDRTLPGPDHPFAIEPDEIIAMVKNIREAEAAMGDGRKVGPAPEEEEMYKKARCSIHARVDIPKGIIITSNMLIVKRPGYGIKAKFKDIVIGRRAAFDIKEDQWITWEMV